jgi:hypothetical protein
MKINLHRFKNNEGIEEMNVTTFPFDASTDTLDTSQNLPEVIDGLVYCQEALIYDLLKG